MRVRPAQFARMVGVSKQTVSRWVREGKVTLGPDGKLDPAKASAQVVRTSDPARLRARAFRGPAAELAELRAKVASLESKLAAERAAAADRERAAEFRAGDAAAAGLARLCDALEARFAEARDASARGSLAAWLDGLCCVEFYQHASGCDCAAGGSGSDEGSGHD